MLALRDLVLWRQVTWIGSAERAGSLPISGRPCFSGPEPWGKPAGSSSRPTIHLAFSGILAVWDLRMRVRF